MNERMELIVNILGLVKENKVMLAIITKAEENGFSIIEANNTYVITVDLDPDFGERKPTELTLKKNGDSYIFVSNIIKNDD